jgi:hypothetical protein
VTTDQPPDDPPAVLFLRVPTSLKTRITERAAKKDLAVNVWAARALTFALDQHDTPRTGPGRRTVPRR